MNRIAKKFAALKAQGKAAYVAYLTMGAPTLEDSVAAAKTLVKEGADILELGIPFSDPVADGAIIRKAAITALRNGTTLEKVIAEIPGLRRGCPDTPIIVFSYYNVILSYGLERFADDIADAGADGVLVVDVPLEERGEVMEAITPRKANRSQK